MEQVKKPIKVYCARILLIPAAAGFLMLFVLNFALVVSALLFLSTGLLCLPLGLLYLTGAMKMLKIASDLSPAALAAVGIFMLCFGAFLVFFLCVFSQFCVRLLCRYAALLRNESWRRMYYAFSFSKLLKISLAASAVSFGAFVLCCCIDNYRGYESTVVKESLAFPNAKYLYISTLGLDFEIKEYEGKEILVEYINDMPIIVEESSEDYLRLMQDDSFTLSLFARDQFRYKMTIWLPLNDYREFYLDSGSGNITLEETLSRYTKLRSKNGNIYINDASEEINAATISGNIYCSYKEFSGTGSFESNQGNITVLVPNSSGVDLRFRTDSGWLDSKFLGLSERFYGSVDLQKPPVTSYLYVTTVDSGLTLEAAQ